MRKNVVDEFNQRKVLIYGYGSHLRGDDAVGQIAAEHLAHTFIHDDRVTVTAVHQLTLDLAEQVADYHLVILIDADRELEPGTVSTQVIQPVSSIPSPLSHYCQPGELLMMTKALYGVQPDMVLIGLGGEQFEIGSTLSPTMKAALTEVYKQVRELIESKSTSDPTAIPL